jgi:hypothetical protein
LAELWTDGCGASDGSAFLGGEGDADDADAERVLGHALGLRHSQEEPVRAGELLEMAQLEQERRRPGQRMG